MATSSFSFSTAGFKSPKEMDRKLNRAIFGVAKYWDGRVEAHAKQKAPWKDRTSNARNGLKAEAVKLKGTGFDANTFAIILSGAVDYQIYLELGHHHEPGPDDKWEAYDVPPYPIIMPTINLYAPKVMRTLNKILDRLK